MILTWQQQRKDILRRESERGQQLPVAQGGMHRSGIHQQLVGDFPGDGAFQAHGSGQHQGHRRLPAMLEHPGHIHAGRRCRNHIMARLQVRFLLGEDPLHALWPTGATTIPDKSDHFAQRGIGIDIQMGFLPEIRQLPVGIFPQQGKAGEHQQQRQGSPEQQGIPKTGCHCCFRR